MITLEELDDFLSSAIRGSATAEAALAWKHEHEPANANPWFVPESEADAIFLAAFQQMIRMHSNPDYIGEAKPANDYRNKLQIDGSPLVAWDYDYYQIVLRVCAKPGRYAEVIASVHFPRIQSPTGSSVVARTTKQERQDALVEAERQQAIETPRHPHDMQWGYQGIGILRIQLIHRRAFAGAGACYEVRGDIGNLRLYRSRFNIGGDLVVGCERIDVGPSILYKMLRKLDEISVPLRWPQEDFGVLDAERFELATFSGNRMMARFTWHSASIDPGWEPLVQFATEYLENFQSRDVIDRESSR